MSSGDEGMTWASTNSDHVAAAKTQLLFRSAKDVPWTDNTLLPAGNPPTSYQQLAWGGAMAFSFFSPHPLFVHSLFPLFCSLCLPTPYQQLGWGGARAFSFSLNPPPPPTTTLFLSLSFFRVFSLPAHPLPATRVGRCESFMIFSQPPHPFSLSLSFVCSRYLPTPYQQLGWGGARAFSFCLNPPPHPFLSLSLSLSPSLSVCLSVCLSACLSFVLSACPPLTSIYVGRCEGFQLPPLSLFLGVWRKGAGKRGLECACTLRLQHYRTLLPGVSTFVLAMFLWCQEHSSHIHADHKTLIKLRQQQTANIPVKSHS